MKPTPLPLRAPRRAVLLATAVLLSACAADPAVSGAAVPMARPLGSLQCSGGGTTPEAMVRELAAKGVKARAPSCATDGRMHAAMCGASDGRLGVVEVDAADQATAEAAGFKPLAQWRGSVAVPCR